MGLTNQKYLSEVEMLFVTVSMLLLFAAPSNDLEEEILQQDAGAVPYLGEEKGKPIPHIAKENQKDMKKSVQEHQAVLTRKIRPRIMGDAPMAMQAPANPLNDAEAAMFDTYNPQVFGMPSSGKQPPKKTETVAKQKSYVIAIPSTATSGPSVFLERRKDAVSDAGALMQQLIMTDGEGRSDKEEEEDEEDWD